MNSPELGWPGTCTPPTHTQTNTHLLRHPRQAYDITELVPEPPKEGTGRRIRQLMDPDLLDLVDTSCLEPFAVETTGPDGATMAPFCRRAGRVIKVRGLRVWACGVLQAGGGRGGGAQHAPCLPCFLCWGWDWPPHPTPGVPAECWLVHHTPHGGA